MTIEIRVRFGKAIMELLGAMMLVLTIQLAVGSGSPLAPVGIGVVLITLVYAGAPISGAHYNPAITLALWLRGATHFHVMIVYWIFQIAGGILGGLLGGAIGASYNATAVGMGYHFGQAFLAELVFTFLLCFNVLGVATNTKAENNQYYGMAIGLTVMAGAISVGGISGGAFNPAVALGLGISKSFYKMAYVGLIVVGELVGGAIAALLFFVVAPDEFEHFGDEAHGVMEAPELQTHAHQQHQATESTGLIT